MIWYLLFAAIAGTIATENPGIRPYTLTSFESKCNLSCVAEGGNRSECTRHCKCAKERFSVEFTESEIISFGIREMYGQKRKYTDALTLAKIAKECRKLK